MTTVFNGNWWFLSLPSNWNGSREEQGYSFFGDPRLGTLQISAAQKEAENVRDEDLREFAQESLQKGARLQSVRVGRLVGFLAQRREGDLSWKEWWLREGKILLYVTYVVPIKDEKKESNQVVAILESLTVKPTLSSP